MVTISDSQLQTDVMNELRCEPRLTPEKIGVAVHNGIVTLSGTVPNYAEKMAAEKATLRVRGVKGVAEEIEVHLLPTSKKNDTEIAEAVANALAWHVWAPDNIKTKVENGWVTLSGEVEYQFQRSAAHDSVRFLGGVRGVTNNIAIKKSVNVDNIQDAIEKALVRDAELEAEHIHVAAEGSTVTLSGRVHSAWERQAASDAAWRAAGVSKVQNQLEIA